MPLGPAKYYLLVGVNVLETTLTPGVPLTFSDRLKTKCVTSRLVFSS